MMCVILYYIRSVHYSRAGVDGGFHGSYVWLSGVGNGSHVVVRQSGAVSPAPGAPVTRAHCLAILLDMGTSSSIGQPGIPHTSHCDTTGTGIWASGTGTYYTLCEGTTSNMHTILYSNNTIMLLVPRAKYECL